MAVDDTIVIGGGVVGLACANALLDAGRGVRVLERERVGAGASHGNCGLVTPSHALPLTRPGMLAKALAGMWREDSPLFLRPRLDPAFWSWGVRFALNCRRAGMLRALEGRKALLESSRDLFDDWVRRDALQCEWEELGLLEVFATEEGARAAESAHELLEEHGVHSDPVPHAELLAREPALREDVCSARFYPRDAQVRPDRLVAELARVVRAKGGVIEEGVAVRGARSARGRLEALDTDRGEVQGAVVVLATGAWSPLLGRALGLSLPVEAGKGYSITMRRPEPCPRVPLLLAEASMAVTPWPSGFRLGGTMELTGRNMLLRRARVEALRRGAARFLKEPLGEGAPEEWCGWRPMTPDELPIIDRSPRQENLFLATGHGMMGVSMATGTAQLVVELVTGRAPHVDPAPYAVGRFG